MVSNVLLIISTWFLMLLLLGLHEQFMSHFFLWIINSIKKLSSEVKFVGNKAKGRISKRVFQENKARQIFREANISYPIRIVRNVRFSENLACFVFLKHQLWDSHFCLITDELWLKILAGMSSRTYNIISPPFLSRSNLNGGWKPSIKNETSRKVSSNFDSDNIKIAIYPLICSQGKLNLFLKESIFRYPNINLLILSTRISSRELTVFEITVVEERHFPFQYKNTNPLMG